MRLKSTIRSLTLVTLLVLSNPWACSDDLTDSETGAVPEGEKDTGEESADLDTRDAETHSDAREVDTGDVDDLDAGGDTEIGLDAGDLDAGADASQEIDLDTGPDAETDADEMDAGDVASDAEIDGDVGVDADVGSSQDGCVSGASGTHAVRFRWAGSGSGSTAYVVYEENELPDTSRWLVNAYSSNISYTPVFADVFLGDGGLDLSGTVFINVELSTQGLSSINNATIAIYGRSYNTTSSGSFTWQTFSGTGASPSGSVANSAPYQWYEADATAALPAGDDSILLRLRPGPPSNSLIVNRVEVCFDAN